MTNARSHSGRMLRWPGGILASAFACVVIFDRVLTHPKLALQLASETTRTQFFAGMSGTAGAVLGFFSAAIAILVALDPRRPIVSDLRRGESMGLLVVNLLAGCAWTLILAGMSIAGWLVAGVGSNATFVWVYETLGIAAFFQFVVGGFFFALVTVKVARHE